MTVPAPLADPLVDRLADPLATASTRPTRPARPARTRDRILETARELFNARGLDRVTTAEIARHLHISEGNLWYHFRTKGDLIVALVTELEVAAAENLTREPPADATLLDFFAYTRRAFALMLEYRFLYRDTLGLVLGSECLRARAGELTRTARERIAAIHRAMVARGYLRADPGTLDRLGVTVWIVGRFWLDYLFLAEDEPPAPERAIVEGVAQIASLYLPYLDEAQLETARRVIAAAGPAPSDLG